MSKNIGKIIRANSLPSKGERLTNVIYQVAVPGTATYIDYAVDENGDIKTPTLDKSLLENDFGKVKTVNRQEPDEKGNIDINDYVQIYNSDEELQEIWNNGIRDKIYFNHQTKDIAIGNSDGDGYSLFKMNEYLDKPIDETADEDKRVVLYSEKEDKSYYIPLSKIAGNIKTVNGIEPDVDGDIQLNLNYISLTGTEENKPLTGSIEIEHSDLANAVLERKGQNDSLFYQDYTMSMFSKDGKFNFRNDSGSSSNMQRLQVGQSELLLESYYGRSQYGGYLKVNSGNIEHGLYDFKGDEFDYPSMDYGMYVAKNTVKLKNKSSSNSEHIEFELGHEGDTTIRVNDAPYVGMTKPSVLTVAGLDFQMSNYNEPVTLNGQLYYNGVGGLDADLPFYALGINGGTNQVGILPNTTVPPEFIKNGDGWSLKYKQDFPHYYEVTGLNAVDLTKAYSDSTKRYGAQGKDSFVVGAYNLATGVAGLSMGYATESYGNSSIAIGYSNKTYSAYSNVIGGYSNQIGTDSEINTPIVSLNTRAIIVGGQTNKILNSKYGSIFAGIQNTITKGDYNSIIGSYVSSINTAYNYSLVLGGYNNNIGNVEQGVIIGGQANKLEENTNQKASNMTVVGGFENVAKGSYSLVAGYKNKSITQGETVLGIGATIQDESLLPNTYYDYDRKFAVGIGILNSNNTLTRRDGFNVYQNGLVTAPQLTTELIDSNDKSLITKEYFTSKNKNFESTENDMTSAFGQSYMSNVIQTWSSNREFSNLRNCVIIESITDGISFSTTTFDNLNTAIRVREDGLSGAEDYSDREIENDLIYAQRAYVNNPNTLIKVLTSATTEQKNQIKTLLGL